ncbi:hypothetical protein M422DRAFT_61190 [Sphaerobolus stellatus SS14]|uniref:Uncharacterized protein n=1 Tax=Sphaerobolus stellatus (strain SS14) TaxID=990650 RepID=A0A0C9VFJ4_SPHS4|nr:hypothetical protein M422DRAFT_61190 [Sphaerobolus stellatus SS14]
MNPVSWRWMWRDGDETIGYGEIVLGIAPKANTLLADQLFSPSLLLAERIERGLIDLGGKTVVELGAGCALPSLLASTMPAPRTPQLVVITDYPSDEILSNLAKNVAQNSHLVQASCKVVWEGYEWGQDASPILEHLHHGMGFDVVILSDLLYFDTSHAALAESVVALLGRHKEARVYAAAGKYTAWNVCEKFLEELRGKGISWSKEMAGTDAAAGEWLGREVRGVSRAGLDGRKGNCWWWVGEWS